MIKIFFLRDSLKVGGARRQLLELLRGLDKTRYATAVCPVWPLPDLEKEYRGTRVKIIQTHKCCLRT